MQRPGEVLFFGEWVAHATCNVQDSLGVGNQMGFYETPHINFSTSPSCAWLGAALCFADERRRARVGRAFVDSFPGQDKEEPC